MQERIIQTMRIPKSKPTTLCISVNEVALRDVIVTYNGSSFRKEVYAYHERCYRMGRRIHT